MTEREDFCVQIDWRHRNGRWLCARFWGPQATDWATAVVAMMDRDGIAHREPTVVFGDVPTPVDALRRALEREVKDREP